jgi:hypothetical protein
LAYNLIQINYQHLNTLRFGFKPSKTVGGRMTAGSQFPWQYQAEEAWQLFLYGGVCTQPSHDSPLSPCLVIIGH